GEAAAVEGVRPALARDVEIVLDDLVVDADTELAAGARTDIVARVEADLGHAAAVDRHANARAAAAALPAADAAALVGHLALPAGSAAAARRSAAVEYLDVADLDFIVI